MRRAWFLLSLLLSAAVLNGCTYVRETPEFRRAMATAMEPGFRQMAAAARFDPVDKVVYVPEGAAQAAWEELFRSAKSAAARFGVETRSVPEHLRALQEVQRPYYEKDYLRPMVRRAGVPQTFDELAVRKILLHGFAVVPRGRAEGDLRLERYRVPVKALVVLRHDERVVEPGSVPYAFDFEIVNPPASDPDQAPAIIPPTEPIQPPPAAAPPKADPVALMKKAKELFDAGLITEEEFSRKKAEILSGM